MNVKQSLTIIAAVCGTFMASAEITLPSVIGNNMVLQQQSDVKLWGKATPGKDVSVKPSWSKKSVKTTVASDSTWIVSVSTPEAGGPYSIDFVEGKTKSTIDNVLIGEVWFCTGQSNMEMPLRAFDRQPLDGGNETIARAKKSTPIRMFISDSKNGQWVRQFSKTPQTDMQGAWYENTPENAAETSATAYYFAQYIQDVLDVPVGIMISSLGGSRIECWMPEDVLAKEFPKTDLSILHNDEPVKIQQRTPSILWNAKVNPLTNYGVRGFLWYQGESNCDNADIYDDLMAAYVRSLRDAFGGGENLPFYYVEIAPFNYDGPDKVSAALLREAQSAALDKIPNSGMASTLDIGHPVFIHPTNKTTVGQRLAWLALANTYGIKGIASKSPRYKSHEIVDGKIYINVENAPRGLCPMWTSLDGFEIAGEDGVFHPAFAEIETKSCRLAVSSKDVPEPKNVRYAFHNYPKMSVYSSFGLPLLPFRTDK